MVISFDLFSGSFLLISLSSKITGFDLPSPMGCILFIHLMKWSGEKIETIRSGTGILVILTTWGRPVDAFLA